MHRACTVLRAVHDIETYADDAQLTIFAAC